MRVEKILKPQKEQDPLKALREKLKTFRTVHALMVEANKAIRRHKGNDAATVAAVVSAGMLEANARLLLQPNAIGRVGFSTYALNNSKATIYRIEQEIAELEETKRAQDLTVKLSSGAIYRENAALGRVMFCFEYEPGGAALAALKRHGFKWSSTGGVWQQVLTDNGRSAAQAVMESLGLDD